MTVMASSATVRLFHRGTCDLCDAPMSTAPGPSKGLKRATAPQGRVLGYMVEYGDRTFPICGPCLRKTMNLEEA